jgi:hypothetical protein
VGGLLEFFSKKYIFSFFPWIFDMHGTEWFYAVVLCIVLSVNNIWSQHVSAGKDVAGDLGDLAIHRVVGMEVIFPPDRHVFRHSDEVQFALLLDVDSLEELLSIFGADATIEVEIDWDRRSSFPLAPDLSISIPSMNDGPHVVKAWVAGSSSSYTQSPTANVAFFVRTDLAQKVAEDNDSNYVASEDFEQGGQKMGRESSEDLFEWTSSFMSLLIQHPPPNFVFRTRASLFVEVRVTDKEMVRPRMHVGCAL